METLLLLMIRVARLTLLFFGQIYITSNTSFENSEIKGFHNDEIDLTKPQSSTMVMM